MEEEIDETVSSLDEKDEEESEEQEEEECTLTTREKPSSSTGFTPISSTGMSTTDKALQLKLSKSAPRSTLLLN